MEPIRTLKKTLKNGEVKYYDNKKYYENFKNKHLSSICEVCGGIVGYYNHDKHLQTKKHLQAVIDKEQKELIERLKNELENKKTLG